MRKFVFAALCGVLCTAALGSQTPAAITVISGNGQLICIACNSATFSTFDPLGVIVTDTSGNPVAGVAVDWAVGNGNAYFLQNGSYVGTAATSYTDSTGRTYIQIGQQQAEQSGNSFGLTSTITAVPETGNAAAATFYESQAAHGSGGASSFIDVTVNYSNAPQYTTITGLEDTAGPSFTVSMLSLNGGGIPNVAMFLLNSDNTVGPSQSVPSAYCQTQAGAGQYTVLTGPYGVATCNVMFGPVAGSGTYRVVVGGAQSTAQTVPDTNFMSGSWDLAVTAPTVGGLRVESGNPQSALAGATLQPFVAEVVDGTGNPLAGQTVTWAVSPTGSVQLSGVTTSSDNNGIVQVTSPTLSSTASGPITVTATSTSNSKYFATFNITATIPVTVSSFTIFSAGDNNQSAVAGAVFANPLAVLVTGSNGQPLSNVTVSFTPSGPVTLAATSATTYSSGVAEVTATAGLTPGQATVTASIAGFSQVFKLTVLQQAPVLGTFVNGADGQIGSISPCSIAVINGTGLALGGQALPAVVGPLSYQVASDSVSFGTGSAAIAAPIFSVATVGGQPQITMLVPCELTAGTVPVTVTVDGGQATVNVNVLPASPGIFQTVQSDGVMRAVIERPDGSFASPTNPARRNETVTAFLTGLGAVSPSVATNALPIPDTPSTVTGTVIAGVNNEGVPVVSQQLSPDMLGVYTIQFTIPNDAPQNNNVTFSVGLMPAGLTQVYYSSSGGAKIPVD
jgi:uncharacterized protein (TIGR03437 family)